ncbi:hypothetical protein [Sulfitobacter sp. R18_1]|uniref:hypothetical protein n=1 Tax=Sulfitobacter sp. R18_1 TaxID=2821104 RepID=UPI001AD9A989|nr:hypothetical protein [Sulfitobacter sp. R18_1]MBO9428020.1 hypothetical protein [Sulfitobacter sp. R18_1]
MTASPQMHMRHILPVLGSSKPGGRPLRMISASDFEASANFAAEIGDVLVELEEAVDAYSEGTAFLVRQLGSGSLPGDTVVIVKLDDELKPTYVKDARGAHIFGYVVWSGTL